MSRTVKYQQRACAVAAVALAAFGAVACGDGGDGDGDSPYGGATSAPTATESPTGDDATAAGAAALATETDDELGEFLVDNDGMTLYLFTTDTDGTSTCYDECASVWPPLLTDTEDVTASGSVDASLIGTVERTDGTVQVTYKDQPLYYFADDEEPGETDGQGLNGVWYVVNPDGSANTKTE
jgi:predicted lipoprotein with Yx(FWY)xxD motif